MAMKARILNTGLLRSVLLRLERIFHREKWISLQYFELASLINLYLMAIQYKDSRTRKSRLEQFVKVAIHTLGNYKWRVESQFRKTIAPGNGKKASANSLHKGVDLVYRELKTLNHAYRRRLQWRRTAASAAELIRDQFNGRTNP